MNKIQENAEQSSTSGSNCYT